MKQSYFLAVLCIIIVLSSTVQLAKTTPAEKLNQRQRRSFDDYDYFDDYRDDPYQSSLNGDGGFSQQVPDATFSNSQQQQSQIQQPNESFFSHNGPAFATTSTARPNFDRPTPNPTTNRGPVVFINNTPQVATLPPFRTIPPPSASFTACYGACQTTPEYNPICASNMQLYFNEQKFNCARNCGADIEIVRRGSCQGLFPMRRG